MSNNNINVPESFFKGLEYKIKRLAHVADQLDILAFETRQMYTILNKAYRDTLLEDKE